jgi:hypothetical protein
MQRSGNWRPLAHLGYLRSRPGLLTGLSNCSASWSAVSIGRAMAAGN